MSAPTPKGYLSAEERAAERRNRMTATVARSFDELEQLDVDYWASQPPSTKLRAQAQCIVEAWIISGSHGPAPRLQRSTFGIGRFER